MQNTYAFGGPKGCIEMNEAYDIQGFMLASLAIGDDEGGNALIYGKGVVNI